MNLLKNFGGSSMANMGTNKPTMGSKNNYFNSIQLEYIIFLIRSTDSAATSKKTVSAKGTAQPKKKGPPK